MNTSGGMGAYNVPNGALPDQSFLNPQTMGMLMNVFKQRRAPQPGFQMGQTQDGSNSQGQSQQPGYQVGQNLVGTNPDGSPGYAQQQSTGMQTDPNQMAQPPSPLLQALMRQRPQGSY